MDIWYADFSPGKNLPRSVTVPRVLTSFQKRTVGEAHRRSRPDDPDEQNERARPGPTVDGDGAGGEGSAVNEGMFMHEFIV